jgi:hypothetical protein
MSDFGSGETIQGGQEAFNSGPVEDYGSPPEETLGNAFLKNIPEVDRKVLEPYIKQWDAGVTKRFQSIHDEYRPYKQLGVDVEELQTALAISQLIDRDPQLVYDQLAAHLGHAGAQQVMAQQTQTPQEPAVDPRYAGLPQEFLTEYEQQKQLLIQVATLLAEDRKTKQAEQENQDFTEYLGKLHQKHGEFDEEYVAMKMSQGLTGEQAIKAYSDFVQAQVNRVTGGIRRPPTLLGGQGSVPSGTVDPSKLSGRDSKEIMAQMLQHAAANSQ